MEKICIKTKLKELIDKLNNESIFPIDSYADPKRDIDIEPYPDIDYSEE